MIVVFLNKIQYNNYKIHTLEIEEIVMENINNIDSDYCQVCNTPLLFPSKPCPKCNSIQNHNKQPYQSTQELKQCPFCSENIKADAIKCKHCEEWLQAPNRENYRSKGLNTEQYDELIQFKSKYGGSTFLLCCLQSIFTVSYIAFWVGERYKVLNELGAKQYNASKVSVGLILSTVLFGGLGILISLFSILVPDNDSGTKAGLGVIQVFFSGIGNILYLVTVFKLGGLLETYVNKVTNSYYKINRVALFFFGISYINYKINRLDRIMAY